MNVEIKRRIKNTQALIAKYESFIASDPKSAPPSVRANIRALEKLVRRYQNREGGARA